MGSPEPAHAVDGLAFGIDIGGTGMKGAPVDLATGWLAGDRYRVDTPQPATPEAMVPVVAEVVAAHHWSGPVGVCFPSVVDRGVVRTAANIDDSWLGVDAAALFSGALGQPVKVVNDADAAGLAEMRWGVGRDHAGVVLCLTFGTGIGSGLFVDGRLVPNTELGHLELDGADAELAASNAARRRDGLSWSEWAERVDHYLKHVVALFSPELIIVGGGASKKPERWLDRVDPGCDVVVASMANNAGIAGAALVAPSH